MCGILQKRPRETRSVGIGLIDASLDVVDHHAFRASLKKLQTTFETIDDRGHVLLTGHQRNDDAILVMKTIVELLPDNAQYRDTLNQLRQKL